MEESQPLLMMSSLDNEDTDNKQGYGSPSGSPPPAFQDGGEGDVITSITSSHGSFLEDSIKVSVCIHRSILHLYIYLSIQTFIYISIYVCLSTYMYISIHLSIYPSMHPPIHSYIYIYMYPLVFLSIYLFIYSFIRSFYISIFRILKKLT